MTVTLYVNWGDRNFILESEMIDLVIQTAQAEIDEFSAGFVKYIKAKFTTKELFKLTEDEQIEVKDRYRRLCVTEWFEDYVCLLGYEAVTVEV